jgi:Mg-chelatase subunit ChlD
VVLVDDLNDLSATLTGTVGSLIEGNILDGTIENDPDAPAPNVPDFQGDGPAHVSFFEYNHPTQNGLDIKVSWNGVGALVVDGVADGQNVVVNGTKVSFDTEHGRMTFDFATGDFDFVAGPIDGGDKEEHFTYKITDNNGDESNPADLTVCIEDKYVDLPVTISDLTPAASGGDALVDEEALSDGTNPPSNAETGTGTFKITAGDGIDDVTIADGDNTITIINNGVFVGGTINSSDLGNKLEITGYDSGTGVVSYKYTLNDNEAHANANGQNSLFDNFAVKATDKDGDFAADTLSIQVKDDVPVANALTKATTPVGGVDTNLMIVLDISGSMDESSGLQNLDKLELAVAAIKELLEQYDNKGDVRVQIVTFASSASDPAGGWMTVDQAKDFLDGLSPTTSTNYDAALAQAQTAFAESGKLAGAQNVAYFLSDGNPNQPSGSEGVNGSEETAWVNFLKANDINSFALGFGEPGDVDQSRLNPIAYNGKSETNADGIVITDLNLLTSTLVSTVTPPVTGNVKTDGGNKMGADNPGIVSQITFNGNTFVFNGTTISRTTGSLTFTGVGGVLSFTTSTGTFQINMNTGGYSYTLLAGALAGSDTFGYTLLDTDGDVASSTLQISSSGVDFAPIVRDDYIIAGHDNGGGSEVIIVPEAALLWNDTDANGDPIDINPATFSNQNSLSATTNGTDVTIVDNSGGGSFTYTGKAGSLSDTGDVVVDRDQAGGNTLDGDGLDNIIVSDDSGNTLNGFEGNDVLLGNGGNDTLNGGDGRDWLSGGSGKDDLNGGDGNDLLQGGDNNDSLDGEAGDDALVGGAGVDTYDLDNEAGDNDTIYITSTLDGNDVVNTFGDGSNNGGAASQDFINLDQLLDSLGVASGDRDGRVQISDGGSNALVTIDLTGNGFGAGDMVITLNGIGNIANLTKGTGATDDVQLGTL